MAQRDGWAAGKMIGLDFETTGVDVETACPVTATITIVTPNHHPDQHTWLIKPDHEIPAEATAVHGITTEQARERGRPPAEVTEAIAALLDAHWVPGGPPLVIYNAPYDLSIMDRALRRYHSASLLLTGRRVFDPLVADRGLNRYRKGGHKLDAACAAYGIELKNAHTSDADVLATLRLTYMMARRHPQEVGFVDLDVLQDRQRQWHAAWARNFAEYLAREAVKLERAWVAGDLRYVVGKLTTLGVADPPSAEAVAASCAQTRERAAAILAGADHWPMIPREATVVA